MSICGPTAGPIRVEAGLTVDVPEGLGPVAEADLVIVPPTDRHNNIDEDVLQAIRAAHGRGTRIVSLCTGAFILAASGVLDGKRATTHWASAERLAREYPAIAVDPKVLYVDEGDVLTSAGSAASIDLCLHLVRTDFGSDVATHVARHLVVPPYRDGGQAQYIESPMPKVNDSDLFSETIVWMEVHLTESITIEDLARRSAMSPRTFARRFRSACGCTPYQWIVRQRVAMAQRLLETGDMPIDLVASASGFGTATNLRDHFQRSNGVSPHAYRRTFRSERGTHGSFSDGA